MCLACCRSRSSGCRDGKGVSAGSVGVVAGFALTQVAGGTVADVDETVSSTTSDNAFRWDASAQEWIFNINTSNLPAGQT